MGYCMRQGETKFSIVAGNFELCLCAIRGLHGRETIIDSSGKHFSWVGREFYKCATLFEILEEWRWVPRYEGAAWENSDIIGIEFSGEKYGDDSMLFDVIAPYVVAGSFITMRGEDGHMWRWEFDGKTCKRKSAKIVWED